MNPGHNDNDRGSGGIRHNDEPSYEGRERGGRRRKLAGYLKAANQLRVTYQQNYAGGIQRDVGSDEDQGIPGDFPDVSIVGSADAEMLLFPAYARRHSKRTLPKEPPKPMPQPTMDRSGRPTATADDADFWRREWEKHADDKAMVDVDIHGWIYAPHRGPVSRKNRLLIALARRLSGIPVPTSEVQGYGDLDSNHQATHEQRARERRQRMEEFLVAQEAEQILKKGKDEADVANRGGYSEEARPISDSSSVYSERSRGDSPHSSQTREGSPGPGRHPLKKFGSASEQSDDATGLGYLAKRSTWNQPADMNSAELAIANSNLMARLKPFLTDPVVGAPVTVFFYNDDTSQSRTIMTNESGHFVLRAALDFLPTHVRVLASETLSTTLRITVTEPVGVSLISDIDDTIKHSAVSSGAKEIFRNTFIRELKDLTIDGVSEWYGQLARMQVQLHYVSNSPWQLYPMLVSYFTAANLPPGSLHLKQYSGMLQGIFEPVAERKKGTLGRILQDFPKRKFILIGDSGEADLEVYTDIALANPGMILGVYIRDVTTPIKQGFFDAAMGPLSGERNGEVNRDRPKTSQSTGLVGDASVTRKPLRPPRLSSSMSYHPASAGPPMGQLIDFEDEPSTTSRPNSDFEQSQAITRLSDFPTADSDGHERPLCLTKVRSAGPERPNKPIRLRSGSGYDAQSTSDTTAEPDREPLTERRPPPLPSKPRRYASNKVAKTQSSQSASSRESKHTTNIPARSSYLPTSSTVLQKVTSAYNRLPSAAAVVASMSRDESLSRPSTARSSTTEPSSAASSVATPVSEQAPNQPTATGIAPTARRGLTSYPVAAAQYATTRITGAWNGYDSAGAGNGAPLGSGNETTSASSLGAINKKEELWKRRWARAKDIMDAQGVQLRAWRVGADVMDDAVRLVREELEKQKGVEQRKL